MQNVVDYQKTQALRDYNIGQQGRKSQAVGQGAFGGSRQAIMEAEAQRNLSSQIGGIEAQGAQEAFKNAQAQQQFGANLGLQGLQAGYQGTGMGMQGAQTGLQGLGTAMQGQQAGLQGLQQAGSLYGQGMQGSQIGLQGVGAQQAAGQLGLAGTAQGMQGAQAGLQGVQGAVGAGQYGLAGLGQAGQAASTLGSLGTQQLGAQKDIIGTQSTLGAQQQAIEQQKINQAIQDWANSQQYPMMQLGVMSNMLRGLPMQSATTNQYVASPNSITQGIGLAGAGASIFNALGRKEGGVIKMAKGGIASYRGGDVIESTENDLYDMPVEALQKQTNSPSKTIRDMAQRILKEKTGKAGGGIIAFQNRGLVEDKEAVRQAYIDAAREQAGNQPILDTSAPYVPKAQNIPLTERIGRAFGIRDAGREVPTKETQAMPMRSDGSDVPMVAGSVPPAPAAQPSGIKAAQRIDSDVPTIPGAPANAKAALPAMPANVKTDKLGRADAAIQDGKPAAPAPAKPAAPSGQANINPAPSRDLMSTAGIKFPTAPTEETAAQLARGAEERVAAYGTNEGTQKARAASMAEKANAADEAKRMTALRMAEFFGAWGSTPGNTIVAGLNALKNKVPDFIGDIKEEAKIRKQIDKDIAELDKLDREEEKGIKKDYFKERSELADRAMRKYGYDVTTAAQMYSADQSLKAANVRASASGAGGGEDRALNNLIGKRTEIEKAITTKVDKLGPLANMANMRDNPDPKIQAKIVDARNKVKEATSSLTSQLNQVNGLIDTYQKVQGLDSGASASKPAPAGNTIDFSKLPK
jgi:hypothetical protein